MRSISGPIWDVWLGGGPAIGEDGAPHGRVTVEPDWYLNPASSGGYHGNPIRWWQLGDNSQTELEVPNILSINISRSLDQDAATCRISMANVWAMQNNEQSLNDHRFGKPGYFTFNRGESVDDLGRWGNSVNVWNRVLVPNALLRTYQGYGGKDKTIAAAINDRNIVLTGVWLIDELRITSDGNIELTCRDMAKLLIEQQIYPPFMPVSEYPLTYCRWQGKKYEGKGVYLDYGIPFRTDVVEVAPGVDNLPFPGFNLQWGGPPCIIGSRGEPVFQMQARLTDLGYGPDLAPPGVDGLFACLTRGAVMHFQQDNGLFVDGICGPITWAALFPSAPPATTTVTYPPTTPTVRAARTQWTGEMPEPDYRDYWLNQKDNGYWILTTNGNVHTFGNKTNYGNMDADWVNAPANDMDLWPDGEGYVILKCDGTVEAFGSAVDYGSPPIVTGSGWDFYRSIRVNPDGTGYWVLHCNGTCYGFGSAVSYGGIATSFIDPWYRSEYAISIGVDYASGGYYLMTNYGNIVAYGGAPYYGSPYGLIDDFGNISNVFQMIQGHPEGNGYWVVNMVGQVYAYGNATYLGQTYENPAFGISQGQDALNHPDFPDLIQGLAPTSTGDGYYLMGAVGGMYPFGDAQFLGHLLDDYTVYLRDDGNYLDYTDIVKEILLWSGWWLQGSPDANGKPAVYGNIETTGAWAEDCIDPTMFDKKPPINTITQLKEAVGYIFWIDEEGAAHFESPNIWAKGNFFADGTHFEYVPDIDEEMQITNYGIVMSDAPIRSQIIISSSEPTAALDDTVTTQYTPPQAPQLRGMVKPAVWVNQVFQNEAEQAIMAELIALHSWLSQRQGSVTIIANPAFQINDQVRIWEEQTAETFIHYIRGIESSMDLVSGAYTMTLTTHWMGNGNTWAVNLTGDLASDDLGDIFTASTNLVDYLASAESRSIQVWRTQP